MALARHDLRYPKELESRVREIQARYGVPSLNATLHMVIKAGCEVLETWSLPRAEERQQ